MVPGKAQRGGFWRKDPKAAPLAARCAPWLPSRAFTPDTTGARGGCRSPAAPCQHRGASPSSDLALPGARLGEAGHSTPGCCPVVPAQLGSGRAASPGSLQEGEGCSASLLLCLPPPAAPPLTVLSCPSSWGRASTSPQCRRPFLSPPAGPSCRQRRLGADTSRGDAAGQPGASPAVTAHSAPCQRPRIGTRRLPTTQPAPSARHVPQPAWCVARVPVSLLHVTEPAWCAVRVPVSCCPASSSGTGRGFQPSPESPCPKPSSPWHRDPGPAHGGGVGEVRPALTGAFVTSAASVVPGRQETSSPSLEKRR